MKAQHARRRGRGRLTSLSHSRLPRPNIMHSSMAAPPRPPPELIEDAITEILRRLPPDEPAHVSRPRLPRLQAHRILCDPALLPPLVQPLPPNPSVARLIHRVTLCRSLPWLLPHHGCLTTDAPQLLLPPRLPPRPRSA
jgi:hypothetical protein